MKLIGGDLQQCKISEGIKWGSSLAGFTARTFRTIWQDEIHMDARDIIVKTLNRMGGLGCRGDSMPFYRGR